MQNDKPAEEVLSLCQQLWSHRHIVAVYVLLLHLWLLQGSGSSGSRASKLLLVLVTGAKQVFELDTTNGTVSSPLTIQPHVQSYLPTLHPRVLSLLIRACHAQLLQPQDTL